MKKRWFEEILYGQGEEAEPLLERIEKEGACAVLNSMVDELKDAEGFIYARHSIHSSDEVYSKDNLMLSWNTSLRTVCVIRVIQKL